MEYFDRPASFVCLFYLNWSTFPPSDDGTDMDDMSHCRMIEKYLFSLAAAQLFDSASDCDNVWSGPYYMLQHLIKNSRRTEIEFSSFL